MSNMWSKMFIMGGKDEFTAKQDRIIISINVNSTTTSITASWQLCSSMNSMTPELTKSILHVEVQTNNKVV